MSPKTIDPNAAMQRLQLLANNARSKETKNGMIKFNSGFVPGPRDVICARGKFADNHTGNRRFRVVLEMNLQRYSEATTKVEKSSIVSSVVDLIREASPNGGFVTREKGEWYCIGDFHARQKVGQSLRSLLQTKCATRTNRKVTCHKYCIGEEARKMSPFVLSGTENSMFLPSTSVRQF